MEMNCFVLFCFVVFLFPPTGAIHSAKSRSVKKKLYEILFTFYDNNNQTHHSHRIRCCHHATASSIVKCLSQRKSNIYNSDVRTKPQLLDVQEVRQRTCSRSLSNECISDISNSFSDIWQDKASQYTVANPGYIQLLPENMRKTKSNPPQTSPAKPNRD